MSDLVERLRAHMGKAEIKDVLPDCRLAADEIERLRDRLSFAEFEWNRATEGMIERDAVIERLRSQLGKAHDACLTLCGNHGFATGHGDTVADIIGEIDGQIGRRTGQLVTIRSATIEECAKIADGWLARYGETEIKYTTAQEYASDAVADIADGIRRLSKTSCSGN
jgi:hypothetical protein